MELTRRLAVRTFQWPRITWNWMFLAPLVGLLILILAYPLVLLFVKSFVTSRPGQPAVWGLKDGQTAFSRGMGYVSRRIDVSSDHVPSYWVPKAGVKYWPGYYEEDAKMSSDQETFLKATFGR